MPKACQLNDFTFLFWRAPTFVLKYGGLLLLSIDRAISRKHRRASGPGCDRKTQNPQKSPLIDEMEERSMYEPMLHTRGRAWDFQKRPTIC